MNQHLLIAVVLILVAVGGTSAAGDTDFNRDIRSILSDKCFQCHGPDAAARQAALRLDTQAGLRGAAGSDPSDSELLSRISSDDPDQRMPPPDSGLNLSPQQISLIKNWISQGAKWQQHWSLIPPARPAVPQVSQPDWVRNPIDAFILARLDAESLAPSPAADPRVLARRLYFDLTGLPPTPEQVSRGVKSSVADTATRLMKSPAYGEKMAIRWLDAARYADTSGYQSDGWRDMWRWRDWVIDAFNTNQPFDEFTIDQLAGDLLPDASLKQLIATGFNRNHRGNAEGGVVPEEFQVEYVVDRVDTTFAVWQGLTMGCARCHDHKYDPFTQRDYYAVFAAFNRIPEYGRAWKEGNSEPIIRAPTQQQQQQWRALQAAEAAAKESYQGHSLPSAERLEELAAQMPEDWTIKAGLIVRSDQTGDAGKVAEFGYFDTFSLAAWIVTKPGDSGTVLSKMIPTGEGEGYNLHLSESGTLHANFVKRWLDDSVRIETLDPIPAGPVHVLVSYDGTRRAAGITIYVNGQPVEQRANHDFLNQSFAVDQPLRIGQGMSDFTGEIEEVRIYDRVLEADEVRVLAARGHAQLRTESPPRRDLRLAKLRHFYLAEGGPEKLRMAYRRWIQSKRALETFERSLPTVMVMRDESPYRDTHILARGKYDQPGEKIEPGVPAALPPLAIDDSADRLGLARWLVSGQNPLTARVVINRLWRDLFGTGLVKTTEDFGVQGERPSHPELLDWLAVEFVQSGWDIQHMLKLIVTSNTYCQSSRCNARLLERDPENRLLARGPRFRLPAEMIRDQALFVSGLLTSKIGGPGVKPYQPQGLWKDIASTTDYEQSKGPDLYRRSLYTYWKRTVPPPMMINFDAAGREACDVALRRTNTPLQALNLLNDITFVEAARMLAQDAMSESQSDKLTLRRMFQQVLCRDPAARETEILLNSYQAYRTRFLTEIEAARKLIETGESALDTSLAPAELAAWTMIGNTLLNLDESVTKE